MIKYYIDEIMYYGLLIVLFIMCVFMIISMFDKPAVSKTDCFGYNDKTYCAMVGDNNGK